MSCKRLKAGICELGDACKYSHDQDRGNCQGDQEATAEELDSSQKDGTTNNEMMS